jgi:alkanesulfonate monooxygenase SsuD/methylene tetrahydromethanopterin reductase-like flavin-dependent oxidoreductase (luciferase family)
VRWGLQLIVPNEPDALPRLLDTGRLVESLGYDAVFIMDHPAIHADPWICLTALAITTQRIRLGSAVNCAWYRHPAYLARLAADLDNLSLGRLILGLGSGWWEAEFNAFALPFLPLPERQAGLEEALTIIQGVWGAEPFSFAGRYFQVRSLRIEPPPCQHPRPPILIGGSGERRTLAQVARFADACNIREELPVNDPSVSDAERAAAVRRKLEALAAHCAAAGRPYDEILRTHFTLYLMLAPSEDEARRKLDALDPACSTSAGTRRSGKAQVLATTPARAADYYRALAAVGVQYFVIQLDARDHETITLLATDVMPALRSTMA